MREYLLNPVNNVPLPCSTDVIPWPLYLEGRQKAECKENRPALHKLELAVLEKFVSFFHVVPVSTEIAKVGGLYKHDYGKSHGVGLADAILAATAEAEDAELKTLNIRHYPMLKGLESAYKK